MRQKVENEQNFLWSVTEVRQKKMPRGMEVESLWYIDEMKKWNFMKCWYINQSES